MKRFTIFFIVMGLLGFGVALWVMPSGAGEYRDSPNGQYTAWANNMTRGTFQGSIQYIELKIVEKGTGEIIWNIQRNLNKSDIAADFSDRSKKFINWSHDSSNVTFLLDRTQQVVIPVR